MSLSLRTAALTFCSGRVTFHGADGFRHVRGKHLPSTYLFWPSTHPPSILPACISQRPHSVTCTLTAARSMDHASAVVELLPRIASIPMPGNPDTYRVPAARAREVRQRLCHELLSTVPVTSLFPASIASTSADAFALLDQCDWHITMAQQRAETLQDAHASAAAAAESSLNFLTASLACLASLAWRLAHSSG